MTKNSKKNILANSLKVPNYNNNQVQVQTPVKNDENYKKYAQKYKFWRYTKKFDVNLKSLIRNTSALSKIYLEGVKNREDPVELNEYYNDDQKIDENVQAYLKQTTENKNIYKQEPSEKEKNIVFQGFKESMFALKCFENEKIENLKFQKPTKRSKISEFPQKEDPTQQNRKITSAPSSDQHHFQFRSPNKPINNFYNTFQTPQEVASEIKNNNNMAQNNRNNYQDNEYYEYSPPENESANIFNKKTVLPIKPNPKMLKKRPNTAYSSARKQENHHIASPLHLNQIFNQRMRNNFVQTPMKGVFKGNSDDMFDEDFTPITVMGELAKLYR